MRCASRVSRLLNSSTMKRVFAALPREDQPKNIVVEPLYQTLDISSKLHGLEFRLDEPGPFGLRGCDLGLVA